ncbi:MAG: glycosyltransferase [Coprococcus phoceensis]
MFKLQNYINYIDEKVIESLTMPLESESESSWCKMSVCIMTYNEERCIARCVKSIWDLADEIIIVDTGSSDNTLNILKEFKEKVKIYTGEWRQDFSEIRNKLIEKATCPLIFQLDADEYLESKNDCIILKKIASTIYDNLPCPFSISPIIKNSNGHKQYRTRRIFPNISKPKLFTEQYLKR